MPAGGDDDMDWLYSSGSGPRRPSGDPDPTRVNPAGHRQEPSGAAGSGSEPDPGPPADPARRRATFSESDLDKPGRTRSSFGESDGPGSRSARGSAAQSGSARTGSARTGSALGSSAREGAGRDGTGRPGLSSSDQRPGARPSTAPSGEGAPPWQKPGRARRPRPTVRPRRIVLGIAALLVAWLVFVVATPLYAWSTISKVDAMPQGQRPGGHPGTTWLLVGSDSRDGLSEEDRKRLGTGGAEGQRTDTMMILYTPPGGRPVLVSLPRDSYLPIPGHGRNKLNAAYAIGGPKLLVSTVEQSTGLKIDHYAEIGFGGFVTVIDALGGIQMCPKKAIKDHNAHLDIPAGCQEMDGVTALGYVRARYFDPTGDIGRMGRQREMIGAVAAKAASPMTVINPVRWWRLNQGAASVMKFDQQTGVGATISLASPMMKVSSGQGLTVMVPIANPNKSTSVGSAMIWDDAGARQLFAEIGRGDTSKLDRFVPR